MKKINGGVTAPQGFLASGIHSGIKKSGKKDLALISSKITANSAGVFTLNKVKAAPILLSQEYIKAGKTKAIIANSGNANACTGEKGIEDAKQMAFAAASLLHVPYEEILVASTGVIGKFLPIKNIVAASRLLSKRLSVNGSGNAAEAILTTDTRKKEIAVQVLINKKKVVIGGIAKGSGMVHPKMTLSGNKQATMLGFITTDAEVPSSLLKKMLQQAANKTFNSITVDKDVSTNDCVFILANGMSKSGRLNKKSEGIFYSALEYVCAYLAKEIARDGEGATKLISVQVNGAKNDDDAQKVARAVAGSSLVKTAVFGNDPNFGRILAAVGYSNANIDPNLISVFMGNTLVAGGGMAVKFNEKVLRKYMKNDEIEIKIDLGIGKGEFVSYGCDMSYDYIKINAEYTT